LANRSDSKTLINQLEDHIVNYNRITGHSDLLLAFNVALGYSNIKIDKSKILEYRDV